MASIICVMGWIVGGNAVLYQNYKMDLSIICFKKNSFFPK